MFSHRSFQEYFTARFIARAAPTVQKDLIAKYAVDANRDSVIKLLYEVRPEVVSEHFILPELDRLKEKIGYSTRVRLPQYLRFLQASFVELESFEGELSAMGRRESQGLMPAEFVWFVLQNCGGVVGWQGYRQSDGETEAVIKLMKKVGDSDGGELTVMSLNDLKPGDAIVKEMAKLSGIWGIEALKTAIKIGDLIRENRESSRASLESLLQTSG